MGGAGPGGGGAYLPSRRPESATAPQHAPEMTAESRASHPAAATALPDTRVQRVLLPTVMGAVLSVLFVPLLMQLREPALDLLAMILAALGGICWGVAVSESRRTLMMADTAAGFAIVAMALLGFWWAWWWVPLGYALHGVWDLVHHPRVLRTHVRRAYPPFCATFDFLVALYLVLFF